MDDKYSEKYIYRPRGIIFLAVKYLVFLALLAGCAIWFYKFIMDFDLNILLWLVPLVGLLTGLVLLILDLMHDLRLHNGSCAVFELDKHGFTMRLFKKETFYKWRDIIDFEMSPHTGYDGLILHFPENKQIFVHRNVKDFAGFVNRVAKHYTPLAGFSINEKRLVPKFDLTRGEYKDLYQTLMYIMAALMLFAVVLTYAGAFKLAYERWDKLQKVKDWKPGVLEVVEVRGEYKLMLPYVDAKGREQKNYWPVKKDFLEHSPVGTKTEVVYNPVDPRRVLVMDADDRDNIGPQMFMVILFSPYILLLICYILWLLLEAISGRREIYRFSFKTQGEKSALAHTGFKPSLSLMYAVWPDRHRNLPLIILELNRDRGQFRLRMKKLRIDSEKTAHNSLMFDPQNAEKLYTSLDYFDKDRHAYIVISGAANPDFQRWKQENPYMLNSFSPEVEFCCSSREIGPFAADRVNDELDALLTTRLNFLCYLNPPSELADKTFRELLEISAYPDDFIISIRRNSRRLRIIYRDCSEKYCTVVSLTDGMLETALHQPCPVFMGKVRWVAWFSEIICAPYNLLKIFTGRK